MKFPNPNKIEEQYVFGLLSEECGELNQIIGKIFRFGLNSHDPKTQKSNVEFLHEEAGDILAAIEFACERGILDHEILEARRQRKIEHHRNTAPDTK